MEAILTACTLPRENYVSKKSLRTSRDVETLDFELFITIET